MASPSKIAIRPARRRGFVAIVTSALVHLAVIIAIGLNIAKPSYREPTTAVSTKLWLVPEADLTSPTSLGSRSGAAQPLRGAPRPEGSAPKEGAPATSHPLPAPAPPGQGGETARGPSPPEAPSTGPSGLVAGVAGALRATVGCDSAKLAHLTPDERDRCAQRLGEEAKKGPKFIDSIPPEKRAYYDAVEQAYQAAKNPEHPFIRDKDGNIQPWGKGPGLACGMRFGGPPPPPDHSTLTDRIKATGLLGMDIGPMKCGIVIPQGSMTPEIGIPAP